MDLAAAARETNIRERYLRALEQEDLGALPDPAYARAFLRLYAAALDLDAEELIAAWLPAAEGRLAEAEARPHGPDPGVEPPPAKPGRYRAWIAVPVAVVALAVALTVLLSDGTEERSGDRASPREAGSDRGYGAFEATRALGGQRDRSDGEPGQAPSSAGGFALGISVNSPVRACLLGDEKTLIPDQVLEPGFSERFEAGSFQLRFPDGFDPESLDASAGGPPLTLPDTEGPSAFAFTPPASVEEVPYPAEGCG